MNKLTFTALRNKAETGEAIMPLLATQAYKFGMVDKVLDEDWSNYHHLLQRECEALADDAYYFALPASKQYACIQDEAIRSLESYRQHKLQRIKAIFDNPQSNYHHLHYSFVYKVSCQTTPTRLIHKPALTQARQFA